MIALVLLGVLRAGTLGLGAAETANSSAFVHPAAVVAVLIALTGLSGVVFIRAALRLRRRARPVLDDCAAATETLAAVVALVVGAYATPFGLRTTSSFWVEPTQ